MVQEHQFSCHSSLVVHYDHVEVEYKNNGPSEQGQAGPQCDGCLRCAEDPKRLVKSALIMSIKIFDEMIPESCRSFELTVEVDKFVSWEGREFHSLGMWLR